RRARQGRRRADQRQGRWPPRDGPGPGHEAGRRARGTRRHPRGGPDRRRLSRERMTLLRRFWGRDGGAGTEALTACTALDVGTEFAKALVFEIDEENHGVVKGVGKKRQGLAHMQSGTVADISAVVDNCAVALQEAE